MAESVGVRLLPPELEYIARSKLNERSSRLHDGLAKLRLWVGLHGELYSRNDDQFLVAFLRCSKYNVEAAKERITYFYSFKLQKNSLDVIRYSVADTKILSLCATTAFSTLPHAIAASGARIHFTRMALLDPEKFKIADIFRLFVLRAQIEMMIDDHSIVGGIVEILDARQLSYGYIKEFDHSSFKRMAAFLEHGLPINLISTHIVNAPKELNMLLSIVRLLMKKRSTLHVHADIKSLKAAIGADNLPEEYGGVNGSVEECAQRFFGKLAKYRGYFRDNKNYGFI